MHQANKMWMDPVGVGTLVVARVPAHVVAHLALTKEEQQSLVVARAALVCSMQEHHLLLPSAGDHKGPHRH